MPNIKTRFFKTKIGYYLLENFLETQCGTGCNDDADCERCDFNNVGFKCLDVGGGEKKCGIQRKIVQPSK